MENRKQYPVDLIDIETQLKYLRQIILPISRYFEDSETKTAETFKFYSTEVDLLPAIALGFIKEAIEMVEELEEQEEKRLQA